MFTWHLRWVPWAISQGHTGLLTDKLMAPEGANLLWSTSVIAPAIVAAPITAAFGATVSYNVLITAAAATSAWGGAIAIKRFVNRWPSAFVGGLLYGFSPYMQAQLSNHLNLSFMWFPPVVLVLVHELLVSQKRSSIGVGMALGFVTAVQFLTSEELVASTVMMAAVLAVVLVSVCRGAPRRVGHVLRGLLVAATVAAIPLTGILVVQFFGPARPLLPLQRAGDFVIDLAAFLIPTKFQGIAPSAARRFTNNVIGPGAEFGGYVGIPLLALAFWTLVRWRKDRLIRTAGIFIGIAALCSLGPTLRIGGSDTGIPLLWWPVSRIPLLNNILPSRLMAFVFLGLGLVIAVFTDRVVFFAAQHRSRRMIAAVAIAAALLPLFPKLPYPTSNNPVPPFFTSNAVNALPRDGMTLVLPLHGNAELVMHWQQEARFRYAMPVGAVFTPQGYGVPQSPLFDLIRAAEGVRPRPTCADLVGGIRLDQACRDDVLNDFERRDIRAVVAAPGPGHEQLVPVLTDLTGFEPRIVGGVKLWILPEQQRPRTVCCFSQTALRF